MKWLTPFVPIRGEFDKALCKRGVFDKALCKRGVFDKALCKRGVFDKALCFHITIMQRDNNMHYKR